MTKRCDKTVNFLIDDLEDFTAGRVPEDYLNKLYYFMRPTSDNVKKAVIKHLCAGAKQGAAAEEFHVEQGNISRQVKRLKEINMHIFSLKKYIS